jgi:Putative periplasmic protein kinase ArgK and related GTPases of G3E family
MSKILADLEAYLARQGHVGIYAPLLDECWNQGQGHVVGFTGPPGVGKSTLTGKLLQEWREDGFKVAVVAVDPSSRRSGGALLGDRMRMRTDPEDPNSFVRSLAARDHLGGLSEFAIYALVLMRACFDRVLVETVGVGQSETEVADFVDSVVFLAQPGSGDALQYMKAGIMEVPHICAVTKSDMGMVAERTLSDMKGSLSLAISDDEWPVSLHLVSASNGDGMAELMMPLTAMAGMLAKPNNIERTWPGTLSRGNYWWHLEKKLRARGRET